MTKKSFHITKRDGKWKVHHMNVMIAESRCGQLSSIWPCGSIYQGYRGIYHGHIKSIEKRKSFKLRLRYVEVDILMTSLNGRLCGISYS